MKTSMIFLVGGIALLICTSAATISFFLKAKRNGFLCRKTQAVILCGKGSFLTAAVLSVLTVAFMILSMIMIFNDEHKDFPYSIANVGAFFPVYFIYMLDRMVMLIKDGSFLFCGKIYSVDSVVSLKKDIYAFGNVLKLKLSDGTEYFIHINAKEEDRLRKKLNIA